MVTIIGVKGSTGIIPSATIPNVCFGAGQIVIGIIGVGGLTGIPPILIGPDLV